MAADDSVRRVRELVEQVLRRALRDVPRHTTGIVGTVHAGTPVTCDVFIGGSATATPAVPALVHVAGLVASQKVSIRIVGGDAVIDGRIT